jgi:anti-sigma regulatory factor (Ser/Thr protein kinase)
VTFKDSIVLQPRTSEVVRLNTWLDDAFARSAVRRSIAADLKLCINEAFANLISYAFDATENPEIVINIELQRELAQADVIDNGRFFDLRTWPAAEKPKDLFAAKEGGFGITLIRDRATRIDYERVGTTNRLGITCSAETGQPDTLYRRIARLGARIAQRR